MSDESKNITFRLAYKDGSSLNIPATGFTLVEFVVTIIVLGIISAFAMSRILRGDTFDAYILRDQIISLSRVAHQASLGRSDVSLSITPDGSGSVTVSAVSGTSPTTIDSVTLDVESIALTGDVNVTTSCAITTGTAITSGSPFIIRYGELGNLANSGFASGTAVTSAVRICLNGSQADSVCVSPSGFAYAGDCDA